MATGDASNFEISTLGHRFTFELEGMTAAGITGFVAGKTFSLTATRQVDAEVGSNVTETIPLLFLSAQEEPGTSEFFDSFTGTGGTTLASHTPDNDIYTGGWTASLGAFRISASGTHATIEVLASSTRGVDTAIATADSGDANPTCEILISNTGSGRFGGIVFRYTDNDNYWEAVADASGNLVRLRKIVAGSVTELASSAIGYSPHASGNQTLIRVICDGNDIDVILNGSPVISETDSFNATATRHGIISSSSVTTADRFAQFSINPGVASAKVTLGVRRPVHELDTSVLYSMESGLFNDGTFDSAALTSQAITNTSELDYFQPMGGIIGVIEASNNRINVNRSVVAGVVRVQAQFDHPRNIGKVVFSATDGSNTVSVSATARTKSAYIDNAITAEGRFYYEGELDFSELNDGPITVTVTAYPSIGTGNSYAPEWTLYNNSGGTVATAMIAASGTRWAWNGNFGGGPGTPPVVYVNSSTGDDDTGDGSIGNPYQTVTRASNALGAANCTSWGEVRIMDKGPHILQRPNVLSGDGWLRLVGDSSLTGDDRPILTYDDTNTDFPNIEPFRGIGGAFFNCVFGLDYGQLVNDGWFAKDSVLTDQHGGWHANLQWAEYDDSTRTLSGGTGQFVIPGIISAESRGLPKADKIYIHGTSDTGSVVQGEYEIESYSEANSTITLTQSITGGTGNATNVRMRFLATVVVTGRNLYFTDSEIRDYPSGPSGHNLVRNTLCRFLSADYCKDPKLIIASRVRDFFGLWTGSGGTTGFHSDLLQYIAATNNSLVDGLEATADTDVQLVFFGNTIAGDGNRQHDRWSIMNSVFDSEDNATPASSPISQIFRQNDGICFRNNTMLGQKILFRTDASDSGFNPIGGSIKGNIYHENTGQTLAFQAGSIIDNNHYIIGTPNAYDVNATSGGTIADIIANRAARNYGVVAESVVDDRDGGYYEGDLYGTARTGGAIGAVQEAGDPPTGTVEELFVQVTVDGRLDLSSARLAGLWDDSEPVTVDLTKITSLTQDGNPVGVTTLESTQGIAGGGSTVRAFVNTNPVLFSEANGDIAIVVDEGFFIDAEGNRSGAFSSADLDNSSTQEPGPVEPPAPPAVVRRPRLTGGSAATFRVRIT